MEDLFCNDINMRAAAYAEKNVDEYTYNKKVWSMVADAYAAGACKQFNIDTEKAVEFLKNEVPIQEHFRYTKEWYIEQLEKTMKGE